MFHALIGVNAFARNFAVHFNNDRADARIRRGQPNAFAGQIQSAAKKRFVGFELRSHELCIISLEGYTRTGCADIARSAGASSSGSSKSDRTGEPFGPHLRVAPTGA